MLDDDQQVRIHAAFWLGCDHPGHPGEYRELYHHALTTDLGARGAGYMRGNGALGACLRRGLGQLKGTGHGNCSFAVTSTWHASG
jgi:hypothetical protein